MAAPAVETLPSISTESKSARKKKVKADAGSNDSGDASLATPSDGAKELSAAADPDASGEHPYVRELQKHMRSTNKKLSALQKIDAILSENKGVSLDELVAQRKINTDQRTAVLKKPQLQAQLTQLEEQLDQYRKFDNEYQQKLAKQKEELTLEHQNEVAKIKAELQVDVAGAGAAELRSKLLTFSQFLRAAAAKRTIEEDADTDESRAFEGALLLVYGGDQKAVDTAINLIEGGSDLVPSIEGAELPVTYAQIKQASIDHAPIQVDETWADQATEAIEAHTAFNATSVDPTIANATLTELEQQGQADELVNGGTTGATDESSGNAAGERWDTTATEAEKGAIDDSYEIIPRPTDEVDIPGDPSQQPPSTRWDEDPPTYELATGNTAGERWDVKVPGEQADDSTWASNSVQTNETLPAAADTKAVAADDGFHEVPGRHRGRGGGRGRGGDGEFRGRGGRRGHFRGGRGGSDGEFRGRGGFRGGRGDGEFRGRGRGRGGPRGGGASGASAPSAPVSS